MIILENLINFINDYKFDKKYTFYNDCIANITKLTNSTNTTNSTNITNTTNSTNQTNQTILTEIEHESCILELLRLYLLKNKYTIFLDTKKADNATYIKYKLDDVELENFLINILLTEEYKSNILELKNINTQNIKKILNSNTIYLNITENSDKDTIKSGYHITNLYDTLGFLLGIESIRILKYQRFDRIKDFIDNPEAYKVLNILQQYNNYIHSLPDEMREDYIIHSGSVMTAIGTTYTRDVDIIVYKPQFDGIMANEYIKELNSKYQDIDMSIIDRNGDYYTKTDIKPLKYKKLWFTYQLPHLDGAIDIYDVIINPVFHFNFAGMKFFNINLTLYRFLQRASVASMADVIMLYDINKIDIRNKICLPNMTIRQGRLVVFYGDYLDKYFHKLQQALKEYYNKNYTVDELRKLIKHCNVEGYDIYKGPMIKDPDTDIIKFFHIMIKKEILKKYAKNANYLLDIGSGKLTDMRLWDDINVKNVVGIEPSKESIEMGKEKIQKFGFKGKIDVIQGVGNKDWESDSKYKIVLSNKYDIVTFQFTLHYMMNNIDIVIKNLDKVIKSGTKIIITCMDGNKIQNDFKRFGKVEVRNNQEPIFAIVPFYKISDKIPESDNNILVYFKGAFGVSSGSLEPIIDIDRLIKIFLENKIKLIERKNFASYDIDIKKRLFPNQLRVSSYYMSMVFEKE
jgi:ubiquinone/menaquinone biosynthesis C-methylase UbiE